MPDEEEDDDKKAKGGKKDDKKADKGKKDDKGGGKDKGGKDKGGEDKGGKDKSGSKNGGAKGSKSGSAEGSAAGKDKGGKDKDKGDKLEAIKSPKQEAPKEKKPDGEAKSEKAGEPKAQKGGEKKPEEAKKEPSGGQPELGAKKSASATGLDSKEQVKKPDATEKTEKSSDKSSVKSATSVEKTATSKTELSGTSSASAASEAENVLQKVSKKSSMKTLKGGEQSSSRTVVRTVTARGPVYAEHYYDEDTDEDGSRNYIEIQMFGRRHSADQVNQASRGWASGTSAGAWNQNQYWNQSHYWNQDYNDLPSQQPQLPVYEPPVTRTTAVITGYGPDVAGSCRDQYANYGDLTVSVWQPPPPQQPPVDFFRDQVVVQTPPPLAAPRELRATSHLDAGRSAVIAQKLKAVHQGMMKPLPDDVVTSTERIIYEVTRGRSSNPNAESVGRAASRVSSGGLVRSSQAMGQFYSPPPPAGPALVRHEMRQSSATRLQTMGSGGQLRTTSNQGMICSGAPPKQGGSAHCFRTIVNQAVPPGPMTTPPLPALVQPQQMDIINQQASIINQQSNIINQQSSIIDKQLNMMNALKSRPARCQQQQQEEAQQGYQIIQQEFATPGMPALPNGQMDGEYNNEMFLSAEVIETNRMPRNLWNRRQ